MSLLKIHYNASFTHETSSPAVLKKETQFYNIDSNNLRWKDISKLNKISNN